MPGSKSAQQKPLCRSVGSWNEKIQRNKRREWWKSLATFWKPCNKTWLQSLHCFVSNNYCCHLWSRAPWLHGRRTWWILSDLHMDFKSELETDVKAIFNMIQCFWFPQTSRAFASGERSTYVARGEGSTTKLRTHHLKQSYKSVTGFPWS